MRLPSLHPLLSRTRFILSGMLIAVMAAPSAQTVQSLASRQYSDFNNVRTLFARYNVHSRFARLEEACPQYAKALPPPALDIVEYQHYRGRT